MTYEELIDNIEGRVLAIDQAFYHYTADHVNEYRGTLPVVVLFPPPATLQILNPAVMAAVATYDIQLAFMDRIEAQSRREDKLRVVQEQFQKAYDFVAQLVLNISVYTNQETSRISTNPRVEPFFTFPWNAHLTAGVLLSFTYETTPTWDCTSLDETPLLDGLEYQLQNEMLG